MPRADQPVSTRPRLRSLDIVRVVDKRRGLVTLVRDGEGVGESVVVPPPLDAVLPLLDGRRTVAEIAAAPACIGRGVSASDVRALVEVLGTAFLLDDARYASRFAELRADFAKATTRAATHAGGAYHADAGALASFIDNECIGAATESVSKQSRPVVGLIAPHMDLWRAARGYGHAYRALARGLAESADTFVLLGTCHAGLRAPFALTKKAFDTPFGPLACDEELCNRLSKRSRFDVFAEEYQHKAEHSIEFQAVFLRHLLGEARACAATIVPVLCGLGRSQAGRTDPADDGDAESFLGELGEAAARRGGRVVVIAGADLAHVGPRFGDSAPLDPEGRERLRVRDAGSLERALDADAPGFFEHTTADLDERRVCGVGPVYTLLRLMQALGAGVADLHHYAQHVDPDEGSIVSHASLSFARA